MHFANHEYERAQEEIKRLQSVIAAMDRERNTDSIQEKEHTKGAEEMSDERENEQEETNDSDEDGEERRRQEEEEGWWDISKHCYPRTPRVSTESESNDDRAVTPTLSGVNLTKRDDESEESLNHESNKGECDQSSSSESTGLQGV